MATRQTHKSQKDLSLATCKTHSKEAQDTANDNFSKPPKEPVKHSKPARDLL